MYIGEQQILNEDSGGRSKSIFYTESKNIFTFSQHIKLFRYFCFYNLD